MSSAWNELGRLPGGGELGSGVHTWSRAQDGVRVWLQVGEQEGPGAGAALVSGLPPERAVPFIPDVPLFPGQDPLGP